MAKHPQFKPLLTPSGWMVSIPKSMAGSGSREKRFFKEEKHALVFAKKLSSQYHQGLRGGVIPYALALRAAEAQELLEPFELGLVEAARMLVARLKETGSSETFQTRYDAALLANEGRWSDRYQNDMGKLPKWVGKEFMTTRLALIDEPMILAALKKGGAASQSTIDMRRRYVSAITGHRPRHHKSTTIEVLSVTQCAAMLRACESPAERRAVGLLLWAGIRPDAEGGEIVRLDWSAIGEREIYVSGAVAKTNTDRHIPLTPRLKRLIRGHDKDGPVVPANWKRVYQRLRKAAGISGQDVTRHTFASNYLAAFGDAKAKQAMGHTAGSDTLFRHYRRAVTEDAGRKFFR